MADDRLDNQLEYSLATPFYLRAATDNLDTGYNAVSGMWELIVRFAQDNGSEEVNRFTTDNPDGLEKIDFLSGGYGIVRIKEELITPFSRLKGVTYIERPVRILPQVNEKLVSSCITRIGPSSSLGLTGRGVLVAIIDSGIDYFHPDFQNEDGTTRIISLWDQTTDTVYESEIIDEAISAGPFAGFMIVPQRDVSGHGTAVAGIACGNGRLGGTDVSGAAPESRMIVVKLNSDQGFVKSSSLMRAVDFAVRKAIDLNMPICINLSFGSSYGSHRGNGLLEGFLNDISLRWKCSIFSGMGNEGSAGRHYSADIRVADSHMAELDVSEFTGNFAVSIWKDLYDKMDIYLILPNGTRIVLSQADEELKTYLYYEYAGTVIMVYNSGPKPYEEGQEVFVEFFGNTDYVTPGIYKLIFEPVRILKGRIDIWIPARTSGRVRFLVPDPFTTITTPATAKRLISVGAYDMLRNTVAGFSGRGPVVESGGFKPDICTPGVNILTPAPGNSYEYVSGTSMSCALACGAGALLMEQGIVRGNDEYFYGDRMKAYLKSGALPLLNQLVRPDNTGGFGRMCVSGDPIMG